jgi:hypothetical protein
VDGGSWVGDRWAAGARRAPAAAVRRRGRLSTPETRGAGGLQRSHPRDHRDRGPVGTEELAGRLPTDVPLRSRTGARRCRVEPLGEAGKCSAHQRPPDLARRFDHPPDQPVLAEPYGPERARARPSATGCHAPAMRSSWGAPWSRSGCGAARRGQPVDRLACAERHAGGRRRHTGGRAERRGGDRLPEELPRLVSRELTHGDARFRRHPDDQPVCRRARSRRR